MTADSRLARKEKLFAAMTWGNRQALALLGHPVEMRMTRRGLGYTFHFASGIYVNPLLVLTGMPNGLELFQGLVLHELGHLAWHFNPDLRLEDEVLSRYRDVHQLYNVVLDLQVSQRLRRLNPVACRLTDKLDKFVGFYQQALPAKEYARLHGLRPQEVFEGLQSGNYPHLATARGRLVRRGFREYLSDFAAAAARSSDLRAPVRKPGPAAAAFPAPRAWEPFDLLKLFFTLAKLQFNISPDLWAAMPDPVKAAKAFLAPGGAVPGKQFCELELAELQTVVYRLVEIFGFEEMDQRLKTFRKFVLNRGQHPPDSRPAISKAGRRRPGRDGRGRKGHRVSEPPPDQGPPDGTVTGSDLAENHGTFEPLAAPVPRELKPFFDDEELTTFKERLDMNTVRVYFRDDAADQIKPWDRKNLFLNLGLEVHFPRIVVLKELKPNRSAYRRLIVPIKPFIDRMRQVFAKRERELPGGEADLYSGPRLKRSAPRSIIQYRDLRVFQRELVEKKLIDLDLVVLIDASGSIAGETLERAKQLAALTAEACRALPHIACYQFGYQERKMLDGGDKFAPEPIAELKGHGGNNDAGALFWTVERLAHKPRARHRQVVIISDGVPSLASAYALQHVARTALQQQRFRVSYVSLIPTEVAILPSQAVLAHDDLRQVIAGFISFMKREVVDRL